MLRELRSRSEAVRPARTAPEPAPASRAIGAASGMVRVACGVVFAGNAGRVPFAALLRANDVQRAPGNPDVVVLDGVMLEVLTTTAESIGAPSARDLELLLAHQKWLSAYISKKMSWPALVIHSAPAAFALPGIEVMAWDFPVPEPWEVLGKKVIHVGYATAAVDDAVFALSALVHDQADATVLTQKMSEIVGLIQRLKWPFDPDRDVIDCK